MIWKLNCEVWLVIFGILVSVLLRATTSLHPYSGQETPPMYGDYEAQRHWMEITTNLPIEEWYHNTTDNNLQYWGLDYPPLTAYHMYLCGIVASLINKNYTKLHESRGYESENHKLFMRYTVLVADLLIYIPAVIAYFIVTKDFFIEDNVNKGTRKKIRMNRPLPASLSMIVALMYPGIILIDHGHFQYNCISLGLFIYSVMFIFARKHVIASIMFCLALNYKQMELYHALPLFLYLLSTCVPKPGNSAMSGILALAKLAITVVATFAVIWLPFLLNIDDLSQVLHRQFPIARGVFEDKVSNFWCALNVLLKLKRQYNNYEMMRICLFTTLAAIFPSSMDLFLKPSVKKLSVALINSSLAFFLFSFQVHEKSILLVAIPVILYFPRAPFTCFWFLSISIFSLFPLLLKDNLLLPLCALSLFYFTSFRVSMIHRYRCNISQYQEGIQDYYTNVIRTLFDVKYKESNVSEMFKVTFIKIKNNKDALFVLSMNLLLSLSLFVCIVLGGAMLIIDPPKAYPDLYPLIISVYCCVHFVGFFIYFNIEQINIPQEFEDIKNVKMKSS